jgi:hypothetical protein
VLDLVRELHSLGAEIDRVEGKLSITAPGGVLTEEIRQEIGAHKSQILALLSESLSLLDERGVRIIRRDGKDIFALWRDADGRDVRDALDALGHSDTEVVYLDDPEVDISARYREFVPEYVKAKWERAGLLATPMQRIEAEAKARRLRRLSVALRASRPSRLTAATVLHGMLAKQNRASK